MKSITRNALCASLALLSPGIWASTAPVTPKVMLVAMFAPALRTRNGLEGLL